MPSIFPIDPSDVETFTVVTNPIRSYVSSTLGGATGSVYLFARHSPTVKDASPDSSFVDSAHDDADLASLLRSVQMVGKDIRNAADFSGVTGSYYGQYLSGVLQGIAFPASADPYLKPFSFSIVFPHVSGTFLVSGTHSGSYTGTYLTSGSFLFTGAELSADFTPILTQYMAACAAQEQALRLKEVFDINRFSPPPVFNSNTLRKLAIKDMLNTYYRTSYLSAHWAYTNYNTLNFFTASLVPTDTVMMYPNITSEVSGVGVYTPLSSCSFDFYINPRYQPDQRDGHFKAGCILHLSSTYCLSLISGSAKDANGKTSGYRLQLQLGRSAEVPPSKVYQDPATGDIYVASGTFGSSNLIFLSSDNSLQLNHWHHVVVRWGTNLVNHGTGTFNVDAVDVGTFVVPSASIYPTAAVLTSLGAQQPAALCLGNFYEGANTSANLQADFFATDPATRDGLNVIGQGPGTETPAHYSFAHPLNAELHDVAIRFCYLSDLDIATSASRGPVFLDNTYAFYVPPFFVTDSPYRQFVNDHGGILVTPFEEVNGATTAPFSVALSFGVAGHYINLENFVKDFAAQQFPLLHHLTGVAIQTSTDAETCNEFLYTQPFVVARNLAILPCDDGLFVPSFQFLASETLSRATDDLGISNLSFINLDDLVMTSTMLFGAGFADDGTQPLAHVNAFAGIQLGATVATPFAQAGPATLNYINTVQSGSDVEAGAPLDVFQQTQDPSSNEVVIFDISNLFYGFQMQPKSLVLQDQDLLASSMQGSNLPPTGSINGIGPIKITLADDGMGNVYRADCLTSQSMWNSVGNVYYGEGLINVKSPHLYFFGQNQYSLDFRGEQHIHVMKIDVFAQNNQLNSSSNPNYVQVPVNGYPNDPEDDFVYITGINFHDKDLNVVMKTTLAQPISKRSGDRIMFKVKYDF
jgi:hypothetical protein